jgi:hypothetical protein
MSEIKLKTQSREIPVKIAQQNINPDKNHRNTSRTLEMVLYWQTLKAAMIFSQKSLNLIKWKFIFPLSFMFGTLNLSAQITCENLPYNPDFDCNGTITFADLTPFLAVWNTDFSVDLTELLLPGDEDPQNELQELLFVNDTLYLMIADTVYSAVAIALSDSGQSAYDLWIDAGNAGSTEDFLASLVGSDGAPGEQGEQGDQGDIGPAGEAGDSGLSAYEIWLSIGNEGTEEDFIQALLNGPTAPSTHGVFDSSTDGNEFIIPGGLQTLSIELFGASGGEGGDVCGQIIGAETCMCNPQGGLGGRAMHINGMLYNLQVGDTLTLTAATAGVDSGETITCNPGSTGWSDWDCGPASSGESADVTVLKLNGETLIELTGGQGGTGGCIGCQGDGCFDGAAGADGFVGETASWMTLLMTSTIEETSSSRLVVRY